MERRWCVSVSRSKLSGNYTARLGLQVVVQSLRLGREMDGLTQKLSAIARQTTGCYSRESSGMQGSG
jgi:hypothetical protein